jgi:hypothetical protein
MLAGSVAPAVKSAFIGITTVAFQI